MMKNLLPFFCLLLLGGQLHSQAIFDASIHTAVGFGDVNSPAAEGPQNIIDQDETTKFLDFNLGDGIGFEVDLLGDAQVASIIEIVTANDAPARDPVEFIVSGSNDGMEFDDIANGVIPCNSERFLSRTFGFTNTEAYSYYRVVMQGQCGPANSNQVADVQLYSVIGSAPVLSCPDTIDLAVDAGQCFATGNFQITAEDDEDGALQPELISGIAAGGEFPVGSTTVTYGVTDSDGNLGSCNFIVRVTDDEAPVVECSEIVVTVPPGSTGISVDYSGIASDNCSLISPKEGFIPLLTINGSAYYLSETSFTPIDALADALNNDGFIATIRSAEDEAAIRAAVYQIASIELLIGYSDIDDEGNFTWFSGDPSTYTNWNDNEPNDASTLGEDFTVMIPQQGWNDVAEDAGPYFYVYEEPYRPIVTDGNQSGDNFPIGTTSNTVEYYDAAGNVTICTFDVTVQVGTSTQDAYLANALQLSGNPVQTELTVRNEAAIALETLTLYGLDGRILRVFDQNGARTAVTLDLGDLQAGVYLLEIQTDEGRVTKKVVKQ